MHLDFEGGLGTYDFLFIPILLQKLSEDTKLQVYSFIRQRSGTLGIYFKF